MQNKKFQIVCALIFLSLLVVSMSNASSQDLIPCWNDEWSFSQNLEIPLPTNDINMKYQPIDIRLSFDNLCWTISPSETSIRVCCFYKNNWYELESQIYDLNFIDSNHIDKCGLVFLIPEFADGTENYYVYYDDAEKPSPDYDDHVILEDLYYLDSPVSDISAEAQFYGIKQDDYCIFGVGQEGTLLEESFSQIVIKQKNNMKEYDILNSDQIVSFAFSYFKGDTDEYEVSTDDSFVTKKIFIDGNLMVEFGVVSQSSNGVVRTTAIYRYYYNPTDNKRLNVRVKHEFFEEDVVKGLEEIDGRYGALISMRIKSPSIERLNTGSIYPLINFFGENDNIEEYQLDMNPESKNREWLISYKDDADLGKEAWISYGEGKKGKSNSVIFCSNEGILKSGFDERDGIQLKAAEKEYFNFLGTEVDYVSINFGRNSYERGYSHDKTIPEDFVVEFDAELFSTEIGGYEAVRNESRIFQSLVKHRHPSEDPGFEEEQKTHNLFIRTFFGGAKLSFPWLLNKTGRAFPVIWIEITKNGRIIADGIADRSIFSRSYKIFEEILEGEYLIKSYWKFDNETKFFNGARSVKLDRDRKVNIFCTWENKLKTTFVDQNGNPIEDIESYIFSFDDFLVAKNNTNKNGEIIFKAPYYPRFPYNFKAYYRDILIYEGELKSKIISIEEIKEISLYDLEINLRDMLNLPPIEEISPVLVLDSDTSIALIPEKIGLEKYSFKNIPSENYILQLNYGGFIQEKKITIPYQESSLDLIFSAQFDLKIKTVDSKGNNVVDNEVSYILYRDEKKIIETDDESFKLPPGYYKIEIYKNNELIGTKEFDLTNDKNIKIVTNLDSDSPFVLSILFVFSLLILVVITILKKISIENLLKLIAISLIILAIFQPWWSLSGSGVDTDSERNTEMFINPQVMVESIKYKGIETLDIADMPEIFVYFLEAILTACYIACALILSGFIATYYKKRRFHFILSLISIIFLSVLLYIFYYGTSKLCNLSVGDVMGEGVLNVVINNVELSMNSSWGFGIGFYLAVLSFVMISISFLIEIRKYIMQKKS